jgi:hypothetical protein
MRLRVAMPPPSRKSLRLVYVYFAKEIIKALCQQGLRSGQ